MKKNAPSCGCGSIGCHGGLDRRDFLKFSTLGAAAATLSPWSAVAGPFTRPDFEKLVPADKKLSPEWVKSLFERGQPEVYRGAELEKIGLPIGGLCAGQVYLGGDGKLWHWDIFNRHVGTGAEHYASPMKPGSPLEQGFALRISEGAKTQVRRLDRTGWTNLSFRGEYPMAFLEYRDANCPIRVALEAFSPFIPLDTLNSSFPATVMRFTVRNEGTQTVETELAGWLENAVCLHSGQARAGQRRNRVLRQEGFIALDCRAEEPPPGTEPATRPDVVFDDFERDSYAPWTTTGEAFGKGPVTKAQIPDYQGDLGLHGQRAVNSHAAAPGGDVGSKDAQLGTLTSPPFTIERKFIHFLVGGGNHQGRTCVNLLIEDKTVLSATGASENALKPHSWDVRKWAGQTARIQLVDNERGAWGNIGLDYIVFSDRAGAAAGPLAAEADFGSMGLALLAAPGGNTDGGQAALPNLSQSASSLFVKQDQPAADVTQPFGSPLTGSLSRLISLEPGQSAVVTFLVTWHFPNLKLDAGHGLTGRHYATRFDSALAVAQHLARNFDSLRQQTVLWHDTWYDSTLPYWFLDRTFLNTSILATSTSFRFTNGRFYGWEGVGCCAGTCGHVWQYAQAPARLFPDLERDTRERVDFGLALQKDGGIFFRGEFNNFPAVDGQAGTILRALREHQMTTDNVWLKKNWSGIRRAIGWLIAKDGDNDGLIVGNQHNTLDTDWFGPVAWLSGLYLAALRAGEEMAREVGDAEFAVRCRTIFDQGRKNLVAALFDGEYFINKPDPKHLDAINSGNGCHIDQVMGQGWAFQVGLGRVFPEKETRSALQSLWRYNFTPDVGPYRQAYKAGRWYAMPGEGGLLMCAFPRSDWDYTQAKGKGADWAAGYFNECMNGFEYQVASHAVWEGLVMEGLAITRMVHDRYHPARRNPWNEVECGDHYARSMASYGIFMAACGFEYNGPQGHLGFAPRLTPENFRAPFTAAEGWGTFSQKADAGRLRAELWIKWGSARLRSLALQPMGKTSPAKVKVMLNGNEVPATLVMQDGKALVRLAAEATLPAGGKLSVELT